jgi:protein MpaA
VWFDLDAEVTTLGHSVEGRPIVAERVGPRGGRPVVVIGVIHGDEGDGVAVIEELRTGPTPEGVELWLVESMNPDGEAARTRGNAAGVDLNRNFPHDWGPIGEPGDPQYAGSGPASEPETQSIVNFLSVLRPDITIWYHQDLFTISPSTGREGRVRARYAELTGLPQERISGGTYTGVAATWARQELGPDGSVAFIVELGPTLSRPRAAVHADAVRTVAAEG